MTGKPDFMDNKKDDGQEEEEGMVGRPDYMSSKKKENEGETAAGEATGRPDFMEKKPGTLSASQSEDEGEEKGIVLDVEVEEEQESGGDFLAEYEVKAGDNLSYISRDHYGTTEHWQKIYEANKDVIDDPNAIRPGMVLKIPKLEE